MLNGNDFTQITPIKIVFIGSAGVGKTQIINRIINNNFSSVYEPTFNRSNLLWKWRKIFNFYNSTYSTIYNLNEDETEEKKKNQKNILLTIQDMYY